MHGLVKAAIAVLSACASVSLAEAASSIGVNFYNTTSEMIAAGDMAGLGAVAQANWNNLTINNVDGNGHWNTGTLNTAMDSSGTAVGGFSITVGAYNGVQNPGQVWATDGADWGFTGGNKTLHQGQVYAQPTITITGIPYSSYTIYAYPTAGTTAGRGSGVLAAVGGGSVDPHTYYYNFDWQNGNYIQATNTTDVATATGNYIMFTGNTARSVTLTWNGRLGGGWTGIGGLQIVAVPEPTCLGLLGLGATALLGRRRLNQ